MNHPINRLLAKLTRKKTKPGCVDEHISSQVDEPIIEIHIILDKLVESKEIIQKYKAVCEIFGTRVRITNTGEVNNKCLSYVYAPSGMGIDENQFFQAVFCLLHHKYDFLIVSNTLDDYPVCGVDRVDDLLIMTRECFNKKEGYEYFPEGYTGRILRVPGYRKTTKLINLDNIFQKYYLSDKYILKSQDSKQVLVRELEWTCNALSSKPFVFVMPIFMAVGGVERNTIEMMRALKDDYTFCVITMERHSKEQGTLHNQLEGLCEFILDLREITEFQYYLSTLSELKQMYLPKVIWLCNNSPWFEENSSAIRQIFWDVNIVAQDVYDTKYGWIEYYNRPGIKSFNQFIAINEKIKDTFINKYRIDEEKIEVIYSGVDDKAIRKVLSTNYNKDELYSKYGLNSEKKHLALIGRMTEQKDPLRYLRMINNVYMNHREYEFVIVGDGVLGQQVDEFIRNNKLEEVVIRIPYVQSTPELFMVLDGLAITSVYEGLAIVSIEAMSIGIPIISTDTGDMKLFLEKTGGGLIIPESDDDEIAFETWNDKYEEYKENASNHSGEILDFFSANYISEQYKKLFERRVQL